MRQWLQAAAIEKRYLWRLWRDVFQFLVFQECACEWQCVCEWLCAVSRQKNTIGAVKKGICMKRIHAAPRSVYKLFIGGERMVWVSRDRDSECRALVVVTKCAWCMLSVKFFLPPMLGSVVVGLPLRTVVCIVVCRTRGSPNAIKQQTHLKRNREQNCREYWEWTWFGQ